MLPFSFFLSRPSSVILRHLYKWKLSTVFLTIINFIKFSSKLYVPMSSSVCVFHFVRYSSSSRENSFNIAATILTLVRSVTVAVIDVDDISISLRSNRNSLSNNSSSRFDSSYSLRLTGSSSAMAILNTSFDACVPTSPVVLYVPFSDRLAIPGSASSIEQFNHFYSCRLQCLSSTASSSILRL